VPRERVGIEPQARCIGFQSIQSQRCGASSICCHTVRITGLPKCAAGRSLPNWHGTQVDHPRNRPVGLLPITPRAELKRGDRRTARLTRRQLLEELDRPALKPLPTEPYVFAEWRVRRLGIDYPVEVERHFHSVPYRFARSEVEVRLTGRTVEIFAKGERIAVHMQFIAADHMPSSHRRYADWTIATAGLGAGTQGSAA
jgi:hypothetical protein